MDNLSAINGIVRKLGEVGVAGPLRAERAAPARRIERCRGRPDLRGLGRGDLDHCADFVRSPGARRGDENGVGAGEARCGGKRGKGRSGLEKAATVKHGLTPRNYRWALWSRSRLIKSIRPQ